jgi:glycosyltransferase involved in cell wall biosynthesis
MENELYPSVIDVVVDQKLKYFKKSFASLLKQTNTNFELVLVVGYPGDKTREFVNSFEELPFDLNLIQEPPRKRYPARAAANNLGLEAATGDIYIGTQDDIIFPENWIQSHIDWHTNSEYPLFVYNRVLGSVRPEDRHGEDDFWERISDPAQLPIVARWQYASGHSFSLPMSVAKTLRHDEDYSGRWGFEDIQWSRDCFEAGCMFVIDTDVAVDHQDHGATAPERYERSPHEFWQWLYERSYNRRLMYEKIGICPEYGVQKDGFGYDGELGDEYDLFITSAAES